MAGIAPGTKILPLKVLDCAGEGGFPDLTTAIEFAQLNGARIINMSLGGNVGSCPSSLSNPSWPQVPGASPGAIDSAWASGITLVAAAGNSG